MVTEVTREEVESIFANYLDGTFSLDYLQILGVGFGTKTIQVDEHIVKLFLHFVHKPLTTQPSIYFQGASGCVILYNRTQQLSFKSVPHLIDNFDSIVGGGAPRVLLGYEPEKEVEWYPTIQQIKKVTWEYGLPHYEIYLGDTDKMHAVLDQLFHSLVVSMIGYAQIT